MKQPITFFSFHDKNVFIPLKSVYPECYPLIEGEPQLYPLLCLQSMCHRSQNCAEILAKRVNYLFTNVVPEAKLIVLYFKYQDRPNSIRGGIFHKDMREPHVSVLNPHAFGKFKREGNVYQWIPTEDFLFMGGDGDLILPETLVRD